MAKQRSYETDSPYTPELRELVERARQGDQTALPELRELLTETPELWQQVGDLASHVETAYIKLLAGNDLLTRESLQRECERRRTELLGDNPLPIERHLVERVVASWLQLQHAEIEMANSRGATDRQLNFFHKRLESSQKQHLAAINQLTKICKQEKATNKRKSPSRVRPTAGVPRKDGRHRIIAA